MNIPRWWVVLLAFLLMLFPVLDARRAGAVVVGDSAFADIATVGEQAVPLRNAALYRYLNLISVYAAGLYLPAEARGDFCRPDTPKRLELSYLVEIAAGDFARSANHVLAKNLSSEDAAALADRIETLHRAYRDVDKGDRYSLTYIPGEGTELALNDSVLVKVDGADFACAYFGIWLGPEPIDDGLRDRLLQLRE
ncbi:MAG: hypothetical protein F9K32_19170 [Desulfobulbaceae bacterium]|nr:MAG: hypothetical protein F9K32_19170 [Desulfobulbaceae bacterium]